MNAVTAQIPRELTGWGSDRHEINLNTGEKVLDTIGALNVCRGWIWLEAGEWVSKQRAADWLHGRARERIEEERR